MKAKYSCFVQGFVQRIESQLSFVYASVWDHDSLLMRHHNEDQQRDHERHCKSDGVRIQSTNQ